MTEKTGCMACGREVPLGALDAGYVCDDCNAEMANSDCPDCGEEIDVYVEGNMACSACGWAG